MPDPCPDDCTCPACYEPDWKDLNSAAFAHYTNYGSCGSAPWE